MVEESKTDHTVITIPHLLVLMYHWLKKKEGFNVADAQRMYEEAWEEIRREDKEREVKKQ